MSQRISGPGTRRKNPARYDAAFNPDVHCERSRAGDKGPWLTRRRNKLQARQNNATQTHEGLLSGRRGDRRAYHMPGSMTK